MTGEMPLGGTTSDVGAGTPRAALSRLREREVTMVGDDESGPRLVVISPADQAGRTLSLSQPQMIVGHSETADLVLDDRFVSRQHALVTIDPAGLVTVHDLNSIGGTFVNDERISGPSVLRPGDLVRFTDLVTRFEQSGGEGSATAVLDAPAQALPAIPQGQDTAAPEDSGPAGSSAASIAFSEKTWQFHLSQPGGTGFITGGWSFGHPVPRSTPTPRVSVGGVLAEVTGPDQDVPGGSWGATLRFYNVGTSTLTATLDAGANGTASATAQAVVTMDSPIPDLSVQLPLPDNALPVGPGGAALPLQALSTPLGPRTVSWEMQHNPGVPSAANTPGTNQWTGTVQVLPKPLGPQPLTVTVTAGDVTNSVIVPLTLIDVTRPDLVFFAPVFQPGGALFYLAESSGTVQVPFSGTVSDPQSGVASLTATQGGSITVAADGTWSASLSLDLGAHPIVFVATDNAGNQTTVTVTVMVVSDVRLASLDARLGQTAYLQALLDFAAQQITTGNPPLALTGAVLDAQFGRNFEALVQPPAGAETVPGEDVNELRPIIELAPVVAMLEAFSGVSSPVPAPGFLAAQWNFDDSSAQNLQSVDVSGNQQVLSFASAAVGTGASGNALDLNGTTYASCPTLPKVGDGDADFTVSLFVCARGTAQNQWRTLLHKGTTDVQNAGDRTFSIFLVPGTYQLWARISTVNNNDEGLQSVGALAADGATWTHVTYVKRGSQLLLYLDGRLDSQVTLSGPTVGNSGPLYVGGDPWHPGVDGLIDDLRVFTFAVSAQGAANLAAATTQSGPRPAAQAALSSYRQNAYQLLLQAFGTSYEELRLLAPGDTAGRAAIAERLGIAAAVATPDPVDQLTLDPSAVGDDQLEYLFGLTIPAVALQPAPTARLLLWQQQSIATDWSTQDQANAADRGFPVLVDPDLITAADLTPAGAAGVPGSLLAARRSQVAGWLQKIQAQRSGVTPQAGFTAMLNLVQPGLLTTATPGGPTRLEQLATDQANGTDITAELAAYQLTLQSFGRLLTISRLAQTGTMTAAEWQDADFILTQVQKQADPAGYPAWLTQETGISLSPTWFQIADSPPLPAWRASPAARAAWVRLLQARSGELSNVAAAYANAITGVEAQALPMLRDALVGGFAGPELSRDATEQLSEQFAVDVQAGGALRSTRLQTAVDTVIDVIQSVRDGLFPAWHPARGWMVPDEVSFDVQWPWFASAARWVSAMRAFLYPENLLQPNLLPSCTAGLSQLISAVQANTALSPDDARAQAASFLGPVRDRLQGSQLAGKDPALILRLDSDPDPTSHSYSWSDLSGNGYSAASSPTGISSGSPGMFQLAEQFDGLDGTIQITPPQSGDPLSAVATTFTISFWAFPEATHTISMDSHATLDGMSGSRYAYGPLHPGTNGLPGAAAGAGVSVGTNGVAVFEHSDNYLHWVLRYDAPIVGWTHICVVYSGPTTGNTTAEGRFLYVNGALVVPNAGVSPYPVIYARPDELGNTRGSPGGQSYGAYRGWLADVRVHNVALTAGQVGLLAFALTDQRNDAEFTALSQLCQAQLAPYTSADPPLTPAIGDQGQWLAEVFFYGPVQVALALHRSGEYSAALGWFRSVYDYTKPPGQPGVSYPLSRAVYYPLSLEQNTVPDLAQVPGWTMDLNPHAVAASRPNPYTRYTLIAIIECLSDYAAAEFARDTSDSVALAGTLYQTATRLLGSPELQLPQGSDTSGTEVLFANPALAALQAATDAATASIRQGRNAAGLLRRNDPQPAQGAGQPYPSTPYHYRVLLDRARQLASTAQQLENEYLSAMEKYDNAAYREQDAASSLKVATQNVTVAGDRVTEAGGAVTVATAQKTRADDLAGSYQDRINNGLNQYEQAMLSGYNAVQGLQDTIAGADAAIGAAEFAGQAANIANQLFSAGAVNFIAGAGITAYGVKGGAEVLLNWQQQQLAANTFQASHERQVEDWQLQMQTANDDSSIAAAQISLATDQKATATDAATAAGLQQAQAQSNATFLATQFTNSELYQWMSQVLAAVYRFFLQQASATAVLAQDQLAFERQAAVPPIIRADYWNPPTAQGAASSSTDRRGLTGAEDLLADITQLDGYGFGTDQRRLNLSQTFSLAQRAPLEFQLFRQEGTLDFATPARWFDECFPGHYLRRIQQVRVSVVGLIPPNQGIRATLSASGLSRMVINAGGSFQEVVLCRPAETVALTSPAASSGVFQVDLQPDMLLPFEASGVDMTWQLDMPQAANPVDYTTIADVLISVDYTALSDDGYRQQVIRRLNAPGSITADRGYSLAGDFPDQWYELANPANPAAPRSTTLTIQAADFPATLTVPLVTELVIALVLAPGVADPGVQVTLEHGNNGGPAQSTGGIISTRRGNASAWQAITSSPVGDWVITLDAAGAQLLDAGSLQDLQFVIGYTATGPAWQ